MPASMIVGIPQYAISINDRKISSITRQPLAGVTLSIKPAQQLSNQTFKYSAFF